MRAKVRFSAILLALAASAASLSACARGEKPEPCGAAGEWRVPGESAAQPIAAPVLLERLAQQQVVLLGEAHDSAEDHRWQLYTLAQLYGRQPNLAIGFEMFPRRLQPVLDEWVAGRLAEDEFLRKVEWEKVWGFDPRDYSPLFHFARMNRIPMLAVNVERNLIDAVGKQGWDNVPEAQKEGIGKPAPATASYRQALRRVFDHHPAKARGEQAFPRFVEGQTVWDRAMAQGMAEYLVKHPDALVVGIIGAGHVKNGHGVVHQLKALGVTKSSILLTWHRDNACVALGKDFADALYLVEAPKENAPRLGVATEQAGEVLRITEVMTGSVAEAAGLKRGDLIVSIAGRPAKNFLTLRTLVQRQTPGTWLPLKIRRGDEEMEVVARFPLGS
ncbi:ChaN family lipoprotein [Sulfuricystis multivorans]|uniref:ChaN family lipoprotein n=1 Tax=Sulfuricystis multivorans TaxID=2211108 RepID=UPI000F84407B|nr:ChaN family lipoprotein [Sulfuricystis multivorans]